MRNSATGMSIGVCHDRNWHRLSRQSAATSKERPVRPFGTSAGVRHRTGSAGATWRRTRSGFGAGGCCAPEGLDDLGSNWRPASRTISAAASSQLRRAAVRAVARDRVERVGNGEHARAERDLRLLEPVRIAAAVPALVVVPHDLKPLSLEQRDAAQQLLAEHRVRLEQPPLRRLERALLLEDPVRDPDLPDVVEQEPVLGALVVEQRRIDASWRARSRTAAPAASALRSPCPSTRARSASAVTVSW